MKVSVVATVLNEEKTVSSLLDSLEKQSKKPNEIVIVDGGSTDNTVQIVKNFQRKFQNIILKIEPGSIAKGRNTAVSLATNEIIAQTDGGCVAKKDWLEKITSPLKSERIGLVAGFYEMVAVTPFQDALAPFQGTTKRNFDPRSFLPSGRSVAFRKEVWEYVGGYSECLERAGEDTLFNYAILKAGVRMERVNDAIVYWQVPESLVGAIKKFFYYAKGDAQSKIWWHPAKGIRTHNIKIVSIFARYLFGVFLFLASFIVPLFWPVLIFYSTFYFFWSVWKLKEEVRTLRAKLIVPIIQFSSDFSIMAGFIAGLT